MPNVEVTEQTKKMIKDADEDAISFKAWLTNKLYQSETNFWLVVSGMIIVTLIFMVGAGFLSYHRYQSVPFAVLSGIFAFFYYPFYGYVLSAPAAPTMAPSIPPAVVGGLRRRR